MSDLLGLIGGGAPQPPASEESEPEDVTEESEPEDVSDESEPGEEETHDPERCRNRNHDHDEGADDAQGAEDADEGADDAGQA